MAVPAIPAAAKVAVPDIALPKPVAKSADAPFSGVVADLLRSANLQHLQADTALKDLVTGKTESVESVVLSIAKAEMAFRMVLEIRNRLIEAHQEIMRMQI